MTAMTSNDLAIEAKGLEKRILEGEVDRDLSSTGFGGGAS